MSITRAADIPTHETSPVSISWANALGAKKTSNAAINSEDFLIRFTSMEFHGVFYPGFWPKLCLIRPLDIIIQHEFERMRPFPDFALPFHDIFYPHLDKILGEDSSLEQERAIAPKCSD